MQVLNDIKYVGVNDHNVDLFEGQYRVPNGMSYNSYVLLDEKIAVIDTVDINYKEEWMNNILLILGDKKPDYLIIQHMEPDHSACIDYFLERYPDVTLVSNLQSFNMIDNFFNKLLNYNKKVVNNLEELPLGNHNLKFIFAPMVHWPEVMVTYDTTNKILFSADAFGKFGALDMEEEWIDEARRYYFGIVGKFGPQVQNLLKKASGLKIGTICPLHGPILKENIDYYLNLYNKWSLYEAEFDGIYIAYTSVYGNTKKAIEILERELKNNGYSVQIDDLARCDRSKAIENAFKYNKIVLATTTYNGTVFPFMREFINDLVERNYQNRIIGLIENGSWVPMANKVMKEMMENCKNITWLENSVSIKSSVNKENEAAISDLARELCKN